MWSRLKFILIISMIKSYFGDITVNREASGDTFIANYTCQFYNVVATSNQNECVCRNIRKNGTLIVLQNRSINVIMKRSHFQVRNYLSLHQTIPRSLRKSFSSNIDKTCQMQFLLKIQQGKH